MMETRVMKLSFMIEARFRKLSFLMECLEIYCDIGMWQRARKICPDVEGEGFRETYC